MDTRRVKRRKCIEIKRVEYPSGAVYVGEWKDGQRNGNGKCIFDVGDVYDGEWQNNKMHGKGTYTYENGDIYDGEWQNDNMHGKGKYTFDDGDIYDGEWKDDKMHGKGKYTCHNGDYYDGEWKDNQQYGKGKRTYHNKKPDEFGYTDLCFIGTWEKDVRKEGILRRKTSDGMIIDFAMPGNIPIQNNVHFTALQDKVKVLTDMVNKLQETVELFNVK